MASERFFAVAGVAVEAAAFAGSYSASAAVVCSVERHFAVHAVEKVGVVGFPVVESVGVDLVGSVGACGGFAADSVAGA